MLEIIQYDSIKKYKLYIPFDVNTNSTLYYDKNKIHKIPYNINSKFKKTLEYIDNIELDEIIELTNIIYKGNEMNGYSFIKYDDYKSLRKNKNRDLELKREDCYRIIDLFNKLNEYNIRYGDFNLSNVLLNKNTNDLKLADLDTIRILKKGTFEIEQLEAVAIYCLMYLYNLEYIDVEIILKEKFDINKDNLIPNYFRKLHESKIVDFKDTIYNLDLDIIKENKQKVKKKITEIKYNGYYNDRIYR